MLSTRLIPLFTLLSLASTSFSSPPPSDEALHRRECGTAIEPSLAFQIYKADPDRSDSLGGQDSGSESSTTDAVEPTATPTTVVTLSPCTLSPNTTTATTVVTLSPNTTTATTVVTLSPNTTTATTVVTLSPNTTTATTIATLIPSSIGFPIGVNWTNTNDNGTMTNGTTILRTQRRSHVRRAAVPHPRRAAVEPIAFRFHVSQDANNANSEDLIVSFTDLPCNGPGPFSYEFNFQPQSAYTSTGRGQINMFKINGALPAEGPTFNNVRGLTGSLIGTFQLPTGQDAERGKLIFINQLVCEKTINLRFGITQDSSEAGSVAYFNSKGMGLRERSGC